MNMSIICYLHPVSLILPNAPSLSLRCSQLNSKTRLLKSFINLVLD